MSYPCGTREALAPCCLKTSGGVVDSTIKVYGIEKLRVVYSSATPLISIANLQATVYAFAERAADIIKQSNGIA
jgi:choline dehydrogenase-like flavoprotein